MGKGACQPIGGCKTHATYGCYYIKRFRRRRARSLILRETASHTEFNLVTTIVKRLLCFVSNGPRSSPSPSIHRLSQQLYDQTSRFIASWTRNRIGEARNRRAWSISDIL
ncbi:hypothetical protein ElyMa_003506100 [Elysia marginata]|uniref:Uncharacterized protein n=1 Tax=Elysia marginata TaxID=1093978 RepID=A0AAV4EFB2_9GAST|nr:hypothetical protein ElyMa_003506100 [Elysia marginata]